MNKLSSHNFIEDKRNKNILIYINGKFYKRNLAKVSVFDSGFLLGDGVWTGIRLHKNKLLFLKEHINRIFIDSKKIKLNLHLKKKELVNILYRTIKKNRMSTDVHVRLIISRGIKSTPYQDPSFTISNPSVVIIPEYKKPVEMIYKKGLILKTVKIIRGNKNIQDPTINSLSKLNCILACIEAKKKKAHEALMFDINGNIATNNSTHFFFIKNNIVFTYKGEYCVKGITRLNIIKICKENNIQIKDKNFKLREVLLADEAFITGTFAKVIPVRQINNKKFKISKSNTTYKIRNLYLKKIDNLSNL